MDDGDNDDNDDDVRDDENKNDDVVMFACFRTSTIYIYMSTPNMPHTYIKCP